ncbi:uncharacterized protein I303_101792 [Kwoniella dejecticola CBS 10117]|uniref:Steroid 5-alpha reductase C-terminal domain-containing protein n=1 Tax=Kwoniella dejecticola CBS 10117 TaxID=1296121 RepID=A0A1A6ACT7_9TREE|nr:uncharacterized protein I303_02072 [Kwoniella dejecticola CBS 10117]OBR87858.1 hypothetical protein I303_02072 [Kwoniella dejecticola CBS 10117]
MSPHIIIDQYNLTISFLITLAWQMIGFAIAWTFKFDKVTDFTGGSNFFILALITLTTGDTYTARNIVASVLTMLWAARLAGFLLFRVLKTGSDTRFDDIRSHFFKFAGFWVGQIVWVWIVSLPVVILNSSAVSSPERSGDPSFGKATDIIGIILFAIGLFWEAVGDIQKYMFKSAKPPKGQPCTKGLWYFSRHPPYFGEITLHWGLWLLCLTPTVNGALPKSAKSAQYAAILAPVFTMVLLLFASGLPTAEKPTAKKFFLMSYPSVREGQLDPSGNSSSRFSTPEAENDIWANYKAYLKRTSIIIPFPPSLYVHFPEWVKRSILLDLPTFRFDEQVDGKEALEEERKKRGSA